MKGLLKSLLTTLRTTADKPVTVQYPDQHLPLAPRYMGFPGLLWDFKQNEPACTGCQVCMRNCPTECITVTMQDNPRFKTGESKRRKLVDHFDIKIERCILCSICVEDRKSVV
jgi:NADH-quinone oxidoreductase subunit I